MSNKINLCLQPEKRHAQSLAVPVVPLVASTSVMYRRLGQPVTDFQSFPSFDAAADFLRFVVMAGYLVTVVHA